MKKGLCFLFFAGLFCFAVTISTAQSATEYQVLELINRERSLRRLSPLGLDDRLCKIARRYSREMARTGNFGHYDTEGNSVIERADAGGFSDWRRIGENLFFASGISDQQLPRIAVNGWMRSPSHRRNILSAHWRLTGVGVYRASDGRVYVTQIFADRGGDR